MNYENLTAEEVQLIDTMFSVEKPEKRDIIKDTTVVRQSGKKPKKGFIATVKEIMTPKSNAKNDFFDNLD